MKKSIIIFIFLALIGCGEKQNITEEITAVQPEGILKLTEEQLKTIDLTTTVIQEKTITKTLRLNGEVSVPPQSLVSISSALGGYVKSIKLLPGMYFKKGEIIATIEDNQFIEMQQDYLTVKAQLYNSEAQYNRQKELNLSKASSDKVDLQAKSDFESLLISKHSLEKKLNLVGINIDNISINNITAQVAIYGPFDGYVSEIFVNKGKYVSADQVLFELVNLSDLYVKLKVFEQDLGSIEIGQPVIVYTNSKPDVKYEATIIQTGKSFSTTRTVEVYAKLKTVDSKLIPGLYINAEIIIPESKNMALPGQSVVSFEGKDYVFEVLEQNCFNMIEVELGDSGNGWVGINNSMDLQGKNIVEKGTYALLMSLKNRGEE